MPSVEIVMFGLKLFGDILDSGSRMMVKASEGDSPKKNKFSFIY